MIVGKASMSAAKASCEKNLSLLLRWQTKRSIFFSLARMSGTLQNRVLLYRKNISWMTWELSFWLPNLFHSVSRQSSLIYKRYCWRYCLVSFATQKSNLPLPDIVVTLQTCYANLQIKFLTYGFFLYSRKFTWRTCVKSCVLFHLLFLYFPFLSPAATSSISNINHKLLARRRSAPINTND